MTPIAVQLRTAEPQSALPDAAALRDTAARAEALVFEIALKSAEAAKLGPADAASDGDDDGAGEDAFRDMEAALHAEALARVHPLGLLSASVPLAVAHGIATSAGDAR